MVDVDVQLHCGVIEAVHGVMSTQVPGGQDPNAHAAASSAQQLLLTQVLEIGHWLLEPSGSDRPRQSHSPAARPPSPVEDMAMSGMGVLQVAWQLPLQHEVPAPQVWPPHEQAPLAQVSPLVHALPQVPQLRRSFIRLAQPALGQQVWPMPQGAPDGRQPHLPPMQTVPPVQAALQPPQLLRSMLVLMHCWPQQVPWQFSGWLGQMSPPPPMSFLGMLVLLSLQPVIPIKKTNSRRIRSSPAGGPYLALPSL
jgi:hypothetical protein